MAKDCLAPRTFGPLLAQNNPKNCRETPIKGFYPLLSEIRSRGFEPFPHEAGSFIAHPRRTEEYMAICCKYPRDRSLDTVARSFGVRAICNAYRSRLPTDRLTGMEADHSRSSFSSVSSGRCRALCLLHTRRIGPATRQIDLIVVWSVEENNAAQLFEPPIERFDGFFKVVFVRGREILRIEV